MRLIPQIGLDPSRDRCVMNIEALSDLAISVTSQVQTNSLLTYFGFVSSCLLDGCVPAVAHRAHVALTSSFCSSYLVLPLCAFTFWAFHKLIYL